ncbi:MAG TPA: hypothetical protein VFE41_31015 [Acetobacteraceae bacterium]|jgi:hypothetical protein|nr:hypothetical protein [Acetobacteraceae bacterium]
MTDATEEQLSQRPQSADVISVGISADYLVGEPMEIFGFAFPNTSSVALDDPAVTKCRVHAYNGTQGYHYFLKDYQRKAPALKMVKRLGKHFGVELAIDYVLNLVRWK